MFLKLILLTVGICLVHRPTFPFIGTRKEWRVSLENPERRNMTGYNSEMDVSLLSILELYPVIFRLSGFSRRERRKKKRGRTRKKVVEVILHLRGPS